MKSIAIIPARFASTRFPGKPLTKIRGISMIERVYRQAEKCQELDAIWVATDDDRIIAEVKNFGGNVIQTSEDCPSGTDRCAEAFQKLGIAGDFVLNIQGDEPFIRPKQLSQIILLMKESLADIGTLCKRLTEIGPVFNPNVVKLVKSDQGRALYFSRNPIPYVRGFKNVEWITKADFFKHIGLYAYRAEVLIELTKLPQSTLERAESLEQLRWLEGGYDIFVTETAWESIGIDTPEDLRWVEENWNEISQD